MSLVPYQGSQVLWKAGYDVTASHLGVQRVLDIQGKSTERGHRVR